MKSENIKKGFANNNNSSRSRGRMKKKEAAKIQRKLQVPPVGDKKRWRRRRRRRGAQGRDLKMQNEIESAGKCVTGWVCTLMCVCTRGATVCVRASVSVCASAWLGLKFFKLVSMRNETKNQQFLFWWFFQHYARRSFPGLKHLMVILDWTTAKTAQDATNCFRRSEPTPPPPNKKMFPFTRAFSSKKADSFFFL